VAEARAKIGLAEYGDGPDAEGLIPLAQTLLAGVVTALEIHRPIRRYWCQECQTLYPCTTRREITAALLGETADD
jgi:hypothetical protein